MRRSVLRPGFAWCTACAAAMAVGVALGRYQRPERPIQVVGNSRAREGLNRAAWQYMYPTELANEVRDSGIAYVPVGILEWHHEHLPLGTDGLKAQGLCLRLAAETGGAVLPPVYFGIPVVMGWDEQTADPGDRRTDLLHGGVPYSPELLAAALAETLQRLDQMGLCVVVLLTGHTSPEQIALLGKAAAAHMAQSETGMRVLPFTDAILIQTEGLQDLPGRASRERALLGEAASMFGYAMDHAESWETSILWALMPSLVDVGRIPADWPQPGPKCVRSNASPERGEVCISLLEDMAAPFIIHHRDAVREGRGAGGSRTQELP